MVQYVLSKYNICTKQPSCEKSVWPQKARMKNDIKPKVAGYDDSTIQINLVPSPVKLEDTQIHLNCHY